MEKRDGFVFYESWFEAIKLLKDSDKLIMYDKICSYGLGYEMDLPQHLKVIWLLIQPLIDSNNKRYKDGKKGGRPPKEKTSGLENKNHRLSNPKPKEKENVKDKEKENDNDKQINVSGFLEWFNSMLLKHNSKLGKFKTLSQTDINNLIKLKQLNFDNQDWEKVFISMNKSQWVQDNKMCTPSHYLRNENFQKYLNQFEEVQDVKFKFAWQ